MQLNCSFFVIGITLYNHYIDLAHTTTNLFIGFIFFCRQPFLFVALGLQEAQVIS